MKNAAETGRYTSLPRGLRDDRGAFRCAAVGGLNAAVKGGCNPRCAAVDFHDRTDSNGDTMAEVICFPLHRRQKLVRQLRRASTDNEVRHALKRTAESLARIGVPLATIDAQIRLISLMTRRQMWSCRPVGAA